MSLRSPLPIVLPPLPPSLRTPIPPAVFALVQSAQIPAPWAARFAPPAPPEPARLPLPGWPVLLRAELAAAYVGMSRSTFDAAVKAGTAPAPAPSRVGGIRAWRRAELDAWAGQGDGTPAPAAECNPWDALR